ncbi:PREDICTED: uncharacterized protein LOC108555395 [Eufriesea mexicana]|uniref:uncharacterized protein LOC108555395 n=1 Tax=Eufriesea mexicana TaxID=516756 RepID=UPI00083BA869|nr:PREDICTED: uncharacterized protein LOC108555395 [Eufriesea mexicana]
MVTTILEHDVCHPFRKESFPMNGEIMATGNLDLQYLDLSYNRLTKSILQELIDCLYYQNYMLLGDRRRGLLHLLVEVMKPTVPEINSSYRCEYVFQGRGH